MTKPSTIGVVGAGAWGTALALMATRAGNDVVLWTRNSEAAESMRRTGENTARLAGTNLGPAIRATSNAADLAEAGLWLLAVPAQAMRSTLVAIRPHAPADLHAVITAKGIEKGTLRFLTDVLAEEMPDAVPLVLSGPSFAKDVARGLPTAVTLAAPTLETARPIAEMLGTATFRPYVSDDLSGVQIGGAIKNVLAIASGIVVGRGLGESARAALIARAFAELARFGRAFGARPETLAGLSGLGDLVLSCSSSQSRNFAFGLAIGEGADPENAGGGLLTEGVHTAEAALMIARRHGVDVPIMEAVSDIIHRRADIDAVVANLMQRPLRPET